MATPQRPEPWAPEHRGLSRWCNPVPPQSCSSPPPGQGYRIWPIFPSSRAEPPEGRRSRGTFFCDASTKQVPPLRLATRGSGRDDGSLRAYAIALPLGGEVGRGGELRKPGGHLT